MHGLFRTLFEQHALHSSRSRPRAQSSGISSLRLGRCGETMMMRVDAAKSAVSYPRIHGETCETAFRPCRLAAGVARTEDQDPDQA